jgi:initiation factor 1A
MVKNKHGGNKHKSFARKFVNAKPDNRLRLAEDENELYAVATKMLGNNMFHCICIDGVTRLAYIRGKFAGRGKRDNMIHSGTWLLVGIRDWDTHTDDKKKLQQCDLLEVYSDYDVEKLKDSVDVKWSIFNDSNTTNTNTNTNEDSIYFATEKDIEREKLLEEMTSNKTTKIKLDNDEEIDIDMI